MKLLAKPGDYLITENKEIFRIIDRYEHGTVTVYDIKGLKLLSYDLQDSYGNYTLKAYQEIKGITDYELRLLGRVIPEDKATKTLEVLYKK